MLDSGYSTKTSSFSPLKMHVAGMIEIITAINWFDPYWNDCIYVSGRFAEKKSTLLHFACVTIRRMKLLIKVKVYEVNHVEVVNMKTRTHYCA